MCLTTNHKPVFLRFDLQIYIFTPYRLTHCASATCECFCSVSVSLGRGKIIRLFFNQWEDAYHLVFWMWRRRVVIMKVGGWCWLVLVVRRTTYDVRGRRYVESSESIKQWVKYSMSVWYRIVLSAAEAVAVVVRTCLCWYVTVMTSVTGIECIVILESYFFIIITTNKIEKKYSVIIFVVVDSLTEFSNY